MANIHGLGSVGKKTEPKDMEQFSSVGKTSSTAVLRPTGQGNGLSDDIIQKARGLAGQNAQAPTENVATITLYANGFQVNDEPFRSGEDSENKQFLEDLKNGEVPQELEEECRRKFSGNVRQVGVSLVNKTHETFVPPKPKFDFAKSQGTALGSSSSSASALSFSNARPKPIVVEEKEESTTIQIVLHNKQRIKQKFNTSHTVLDLYQHILHASNYQGSFGLLAGFPPKPLNNPSQTIKEAGLINASVQMKV